MDWSVSFEPVLPWALIALAGVAGECIASVVWKKPRCKRGIG
jgi:hypothetical protein